MVLRCQRCLVVIAPAICHSLAIYARPCIIGEINRYFRDTRWQIHVKRPVKELMLQVRAAAGS